MSKDVCVCFAREDANKALSGLKFARKAWVSWETTNEEGEPHRTPYDAAIRALAEAIMQADSDEQVSSNGH